LIAYERRRGKEGRKKVLMWGLGATDTRERRPKFRLGRIMRRPKQRQRCAELRYSCSATNPTLIAVAEQHH
jgi:hypothetical protein